jgi:hypothetical protein
VARRPLLFGDIDRVIALGTRGLGFESLQCPFKFSALNACNILDWFFVVNAHESEQVVPNN